jgi:hypothetical protein
LTNSSRWGSPSVDAAEFEDAGAHVGGEFIAEGAAGYADDGEFFGQEAVLLEMKERGQQLALGQVAGGAEDHDDGGLGDAFALAGGNFGEIFRTDGHLRCGHGFCLVKQLLAASF